ncbi:oxidoreductase domain-containing protein [Aspergillus heteromorphus CBS 117.55]|uniref:Oxidoreductase domain-containing protein n=1 Tax=Aspergillus heteromorphus CBS 117.55 TaxID=1448321 RepID=A0A317WHW4_9EURO|nr:oxidoreductase domain-containing protein [Aspergillus heteromorphus CBS 117.55]PWY86046.1 oxidoreductase domain-containing protein [Aspergillus heteromorphus CBS 117.55]
MAQPQPQPQPAEDFLTGPPPPDAHCRRIDFENTTPPIPEYKKLCAAIIDNALTPAECEELLRLAESSTAPPGKPPVWDRAMINIGGGRQIIATDSRNCGRIIFDTPLLASRLLARLMPFLHDLGIDRVDDQPLVTGLAGRYKSYRLTRLNERLRFLRYEGGEYFRPHWDACYSTPDRTEKSFYTVHLYLNGSGEQDLRELEREGRRAEREEREGAGYAEGGWTGNLDKEGELLGGATSFLPRYEEKDRLLRVFPKMGSVLVFQQRDLLHGGDPVFRGRKFTVRTDVMYELV